MERGERDNTSMQESLIHSQLQVIVHWLQHKLLHNFSRSTIIDPKRKWARLSHIVSMLNNAVCAVCKVNIIEELFRRNP